jgi:hypothetical protein
MYYVWCMMCDDWAVYQELFMYLCYFDMFYIQWHHLAKKDIWNKVHMNINMYAISVLPHSLGQLFPVRYWYTCYK